MPYSSFLDFTRDYLRTFSLLNLFVVASASLANVFVDFLVADLSHLIESGNMRSNMKVVSINLSSLVVAPISHNN